MGFYVIQRRDLRRRIPPPDAGSHVPRGRSDVQNREWLAIRHVFPEQMAERRMPSPTPVYPYQILQAGACLIGRQAVQKFRQNQALTKAVHIVPTQVTSTLKQLLK